MFGPLQESVHIPSQKIAWVNHKASSLRILIQSPGILTGTYGIPREGPFYATGKSGASGRLPFCHARKQHPDEVDYASVEEFYKKLQEIDARCGSSEFRVKMLGETAQKYAYQAIVRMRHRPR